ncbi:hypothetical protein [Nocardia thraciensis]
MLTSMAGELLAGHVDVLDEGFVDLTRERPEVMREFRLSTERHSFTDHLTDPRAPYGPRGAGEPSPLSSTPARVGAIRDACRAVGRSGDTARVPVRPPNIIESC